MAVEECLSSLKKLNDLDELQSDAEAKPVFLLPLPRSQSLGSHSLCKCTSQALSIPQAEHATCEL